MPTKSSISWLNSITLILTPTIAVLGTWHYHATQGLHIGDLLLLFTLYSLVGLSITAGYHRYFSHKTYECHWIVQLFYLLFGAAALQNSALEWASQHRVHHRHVDTDTDPYNVQKGFLWSHIGWVFFKTDADPGFSTTPDLKKNKLVMWQHRYYLLLVALMGFGLPTLLGSLYGRPLGGLIIGGFVRIVLLHHSTFLINSAAHMFGTQPYSDANSAKDSWWLALFTFGEGYHNFHHKFQSDYRNGFRAYHWDPAKWLIYIFQTLRLASNLRRTSELSIIRSKLEIKAKRSEKLMKEMPTQMRKTLASQRQALQERIENGAFEITRLKIRYSKWLRNSRKIASKEKKQIKNHWNTQLLQSRQRMNQAWKEYQQFMCQLESTSAA